MQDKEALYALIVRGRKTFPPRTGGALFFQNRELAGTDLEEEGPPDGSLLIRLTRARTPSAVHTSQGRAAPGTVTGVRRPP